MDKVRFWCVVPAAGFGRRMGADRPKQYLKLRGRMVIEHTLDRLGAHGQIDGIYIALSGDDAYWPGVRLASPISPRRCEGGGERYESVLNGLRALASDGAEANDWVMVHDAVRPCVRRRDVDRLILEGSTHAVGGVLGTPVRDTMKRVNRAGEIQDTVSRDRLWHAFTPQMFRLGPLTYALERIITDGIEATDEAQAMERTGRFARMVKGHPDNIKITTQQDLSVAEQCLIAQENES